MLLFTSVASADVTDDEFELVDDDMRSEMSFEGEEDEMKINSKIKKVFFFFLNFPIAKIVVFVACGILMYQGLSSLFWIFRWIATVFFVLLIVLCLISSLVKVYDIYDPIDGTVIKENNDVGDNEKVEVSSIGLVNTLNVLQEAYESDKLLETVSEFINNPLIIVKHMTERDKNEKT